MPGYSVTTLDGELYHHGILGQKWGKKQGPPYPLDASKHSASEKKAGWRKSLNSDGSVTEAGKQRYYVTNKKTGDSYQTINKERKRYKDAKKLAKKESVNKQEYKQAKKDIKAARKSTVADRSAKTIAKSSIRNAVIAGVSSAAIAAGAYYIGNRISKKVLGTNINGIMNSVGLGQIKTASILARGLRDATISGLGYAAYSTVSKGIRSAQGYGKGDRKHKTYEEVNYGSKTNSKSENKTSKAYSDYKKSANDFEKSERSYGTKGKENSGLEGMKSASKAEKEAKKNFTKEDKKQVKADNKELKKLNKETSKWVKNADKINDKIVENVEDKLSASDWDDAKKVTRALNAEAQKYKSPGEKQILKYSEARVKQLLEDYGNLDGAYEIRVNN